MLGRAWRIGFCFVFETDFCGLFCTFLSQWSVPDFIKIKN